MHETTCPNTEGAKTRLRTLECRKNKTKARSSAGASDKGPEWWFGQFIDYFVDEHRASVNTLTEWCRKTGRLAPDERPPSQQTQERWASKHEWQRRKGEVIHERARAARDAINQTFLKEKVEQYADWLHVAKDLRRLLFLYTHVEEVQQPDGSWAEVTDRADRRLRRHRLRRPDEYGGRGTPYNLTDLERLLKLALKAQTVLPNILPPGVGVEAEVQDALTLVVPDKGQIAELSAGFGKLVEKLVEKTEQRRLDRGLNVFGEKVEEPPPLDAPGRDMLELDNEEPLADDEEYETVTVTVDDDLPEGVYRNEEGEILPIGFSMDDSEGEWDRGDD